jgi:carboxypeptidase C (cathepsin A)
MPLHSLRLRLLAFLAFAGARVLIGQPAPTPTEAAADDTAAPVATPTAGAPKAKPGEAEKEREAKAADVASAPVKERRIETRHTVALPGRTIAYTATAGTLTLRDDQGKPTASMFYVAYTVDHPAAGGAPRPVTFFYNGGPGAASVWLHLGSFGPLRVLTDSPDATHNAPFVLAPNPETLLDRSDLVFLDAVGAGYSRPLGDNKGEKFWGVDQDVDAFARGITRWVSLNRRWNSPKFLFGESYGTTRSAALVDALQDQGMQINGVVLLSTILNYGIRNAGFDRIYVAYVPSYAAAAWYHHKLEAPVADLAAWIQEARVWAAGPYATALEAGQDLPEADAARIAQQLHHYTGLSVAFIRANHLRVPLSRFRKELLRDEHRTIGRYDARFTGIDADDAGETPEFDASSTGITGAYIAALHQYLETELNYPNDLRYWPSGPEINQHWDWHHKVRGVPGTQTQPDVALDLSSALRENPHLRVLSLNGWYDLATPFFETEFDLKHMELDPSVWGHVQFAYYPSGHMVYLNVEALRQMRAELGRWYDAAGVK